MKNDIIYEDKEYIHPLYDMNKLYDGFLKSMKGSSWKTEPQRFEANFLIEISRLSDEVKNHVYVTSPSTQFIINERGHIRYIYGGRMRDRVVRHVLCDEILNPAIQPYLIHNNGASQKGKGISFSREQFENDLHSFYLEYGTNEGYVGFVDFSKFYDNIRHDIVKSMLNPKIDEESRWLLSEALRSFEVDMSHLSDEQYAKCLDEKFNSITYHEDIAGLKLNGTKMMAKSVNIGDQVSQNIGVFFPTQVDNYVKIVRAIKRYGRYMDDMYVICREKKELQSVLEGIRKTASEIGLFINEKKTHIEKLSDNYTYLQTKYSLTDTGKVIKRINPKAIIRQRRRLKAYRRLLDKGKMDYESIKQAYKSWMGNFTKVMSKLQVKNMKKLFIELFGEDVRWKK